MLTSHGSHYPYSRDEIILLNNFFFLSNQRDDFRGSFPEAIWPFLVVGQFFGILPVIGVKDHQISKLEFKWFSFRTIYSLFIAVILLSYSISLLFTILITAIDSFSIISTTIFYVATTWDFLSFLALAPKFAELMQQWENIERNLPTFQSIKQKNHFVFKMRLLIGIFTFFAIVEHTLSIVSFVDLDVKDPFTNLIKAQTPYFLTFDILVQPPLWKSCCGKIVSIISTVIWNYIDMFIMVISIGLSMHFKLFNAELERIREKNTPVEFWMHRRSQYANLCDLVKIVDKRITHIIFISYISNFLLVCKQLYNSLKLFPTWLRMIYFWYSLIFMIMRLFLISYFAACLNDESKKPADILLDVPSESWNMETTRFFFDVIGEEIALSGMRFFFITRKLILSMAATIITYELVLVQFHFREN